MSPIDLNSLAQFVVLARHCNFRRAAAELGVSPSTLSDRIRDLENRLGVRLLNRSTRSASLTVEGRRLLEQAADAVATLDNAVAAARSVTARSAQDPLSGRIRINGPAPALELRLMPLVLSFQKRHPAVRFDLVAQAELVDVVASGFDAGVRYQETLAQDTVAVTLGRAQRMIVVAAPSYLARQGVPVHPHDLASHACITFLFSNGNILPWSFRRGDEAYDLRPEGPLRLNAGEMALMAARDGVGLAYVFEHYAKADLEAGRLCQVLAEWTPTFSAPSLYFTERRLMPAALRAFIDHVRACNGNSDVA